MTGPTAAETWALAERYGWADAIARIVADAPPPPPDAIALLAATGFPFRRPAQREPS